MALYTLKKGKLSNLKVGEQVELKDSDYAILSKDSAIALEPANAKPKQDPKPTVAPKQESKEDPKPASKPSNGLGQKDS